MKGLNIFLLFPQTDEEIISFGDEKDAYRRVPGQLSQIKDLIKDQEYTLFYDAVNIAAFCDKAGQLCNGQYLDNIKTQLLGILSRSSINVSQTPLFKTDCRYYQWIDKDPYVNLNTGNLIRSAAERYGTDNRRDTVIISFLADDPWHRDIMPVIKEASHYAGLPVLYNIPYFNPIGTFIEWHRIKSSEKTFHLSDVSRFERTKFLYRKAKQRIYREKATDRYWYYDYFHKDNKEHYEVYDSLGQHVGEADTDGVIDVSKKDPKKTISGII